MNNRRHFGLHAPVPPVKFTTTMGDSPKFTVEINYLSLLCIFDTRPYQYIEGLSSDTANSSMTINVSPGRNFSVCDDKFRSLIGKLNSELCGLNLREVDSIIRKFNVFLSVNNIPSTYTKIYHKIGEYQRPGNNTAF